MVILSEKIVTICEHDTVFMVNKVGVIFGKLLVWADKRCLGMFW